MSTPNGDAGCVYAIRFGEYVKIGFSGNPGERLRTLRGRNDGTLQPPDRGEAQPVMAVPGNRDTEHALHIAFHNDRAIGEYYHYRGMVKEWVDRLLLDPSNLTRFNPPKVPEPPKRFVFVHCGKEHVDGDHEVETNDMEILDTDSIEHKFLPSPVDF